MRHCVSLEHTSGLRFGTVLVDSEYLQRGRTVLFVRRKPMTWRQGTPERDVIPTVEARVVTIDGRLALQTSDSFSHWQEVERFSPYLAPKEGA